MCNILGIPIRRRLYFKRIRIPNCLHVSINPGSYSNDDYEDNQNVKKLFSISKLGCGPQEFNSN